MSVNTFSNPKMEKEDKTNYFKYQTMNNLEEKKNIRDFKHKKTNIWKNDNKDSKFKKNIAPPKKEEYSIWEILGCVSR